MRIEFSNQKTGKTCIFENVTNFNTIISPYDNIVKQYSFQMIPDDTLDNIINKLDFNISKVIIYDSRLNDNNEIEEYVLDEITDFQALHTIRYSYYDPDESGVVTKSLTFTFF